MRNYYLFILFLASQFLTAQKEHSGLVTQRRLITIDAYKARVKRELTKEDSLLFLNFENRLMVQVTDQVDLSKNRNFEYRDSAFLQLYRTVAFHPSKMTKEGKVYHKYWKKPLKIYVSPSVPKGSKKYLQKLAAELSSGIDSLKIGFVNELNDANFVVFSNGDFDYEPKIAGKSDYYLYWNGKNQIYKAYIKVDQKVAFNEVLLNNLIRENFIATLGYFTLTDKLKCENIFANCFAPDKSISSLDKELLKYHYSYGVCKGIDLETFNDLHKRANEQKKNNPRSVFQVVHPD